MMQSIFGETIYSGRGIETRSFLVFEDNHVTGIEKAVRGRTIGRFPVITPAFIDAHSHIGMHRAGEPSAESESNEKQASLLPLADALDSIQMDDPAFGDAVESGVLYSCVMPGSGNIVGGLSAVIRHWAGNTNDALIGRAGIKAAFGYNPLSVTKWKGVRPTTRMGAVAMFRQKLEEVRDKMERWEKGSEKIRRSIIFAADEHVFREILTGRVTLRVHLHAVDDLAALFRLVDAYDLAVTVEHAGDIHQADMFRRTVDRSIPLVYGPIEVVPTKRELRHKDWRNIRLLVEAGCDPGLMTDHPVTPARTLFLQTRWFLRCGYSRQQAVEMITRRNAEILGIDDRLGVLAPGKWASFIAWNQDPFQLDAFPARVFGEGQCLYEDTDMIDPETSASW